MGDRCHTDSDYIGSSQWNKKGGSRLIFYSRPLKCFTNFDKEKSMCVISLNGN